MRKEEMSVLQKKALEQFKNGQSLFGKEGAFAPLLKQFIEAGLAAYLLTLFVDLSGLII